MIDPNDSRPDWLLEMSMPPEVASRFNELIGRFTLAFAKLEGALHRLTVELFELAVYPPAARGRHDHTQQGSIISLNRGDAIQAMIGPLQANQYLEQIERLRSFVVLDAEGDTELTTLTQHLKMLIRVRNRIVHSGASWRVIDKKLWLVTDNFDRQRFSEEGGQLSCPLEAFERMISDLVSVSQRLGGVTSASMRRLLPGGLDLVSSDDDLTHFRPQDVPRKWKPGKSQKA